MFIKACTSLISMGAVASFATSAVAIDFPDKQVCASLAEEHQIGLTIAYAPPDGQRILLAGRISGPVPYSPDARLYYLVSEKGSPHETVWSVRTATEAEAAPAANDVLVYRAPAVTTCSEGALLNSFDDNTRFVELDRYLDHHSDTGRREDPGLAVDFHLSITQPQSTRCNRTDDPAYVGSLTNQYVFKELRRRKGILAKYLSSSSEANVPTKVEAGLSSELVYLAKGDLECVPFRMPVPTKMSWFGQIFWMFRNIEVQNQALNWRPTSTRVVISRLPRGGKERITIKWQN